MRSSFQSFLSAYKIAPGSVSYSDFVIIRLLYEATRDAGFWNMHWTITNMPPNSDRVWATRLSDDKIICEEKYVIEGVSKVAGETWLFRSRLQYGGHDIPLPLPVTIKWAGDTPVITLTDLSIPGMGTYTARVILYRGQYAGTWSGKKGGGQIFGQIFGKIVRNP